MNKLIKKRALAPLNKGDRMKRNHKLKMYSIAIILSFWMLFSELVVAENITVTGLTVEEISVDIPGPNKLILVSPQQLSCNALGKVSRMLLTDIGENGKMAYATFLTALTTNKTIEVIHDGTVYCKILRVTVLK